MRPQLTALIKVMSKFGVVELARTGRICLRRGEALLERGAAVPERAARPASVAPPPPVHQAPAAAAGSSNDPAPTFEVRLRCGPRAAAPARPKPR